MQNEKKNYSQLSMFGEK